MKRIKVMSDHICTKNNKWSKNPFKKGVWYDAFLYEDSPLGAATVNFPGGREAYILTNTAAYGESCAYLKQGHHWQIQQD